MGFFMFVSLFRVRKKLEKKKLTAGHVNKLFCGLGWLPWRLQRTVPGRAWISPWLRPQIPNSRLHFFRLVKSLPTLL